MATNKRTFVLNEEEMFIHFQDNRDSVVMLHNDENLNHYYRVTHFGADVVAYIHDNPGSSFDQIASALAADYDSSIENIKIELQKVIDKLIENSVL